MIICDHNNWCDSVYYAMTLCCIGNVYYNQGKYDEALKYYQQAYEIRKANLGDKHPLVVNTLHIIENVKRHIR